MPELAQPRIRRLTLEDLPETLQIEQASFSTPWPRSAFEMAVSAPGLLAIGAEHAHRLVGYAVASHRDDEILVANVAVHTDQRRQGLATRLVQEVLAWGSQSDASFCRLEVRVSNRGAIELYRRLGFAPVAVQPAYYSFPVEDALTMVRFYGPDDRSGTRVRCNDRYEPAAG